MNSEPETKPRAVAVALDAGGKTPAGKMAGVPPTITAVGYGAQAEKILELAFANDVKVRQDGDLAAILAAMEVGSPVPLEALAAVNEILIYLYRLSGTSSEAQNAPESDLHGKS